jgi:ATP-dependent DNA ligase
VLFDLLAEGNHDWTKKPFNERRKKLESILSKISPPIHITPATSDLKLAQDWFSRFEGAGFDGVMAKATDSLYQPDKRTMFKVKHERDCDCAVAGFRWYRKGDRPAVGSLLLGLYDDSQTLQHVGVCGGIPRSTGEKSSRPRVAAPPTRAARVDPGQPREIVFRS